MPPTPDPPTLLLRRHEIKYFVHERDAAALLAFIRPFVTLDPFSQTAPAHRYAVYSLYFDSPVLRLLRDTIDGVKRRYKLRLRFYNENEPSPIYCEIKHRVGDLVHKVRARAKPVEIQQIFDAGRRGSGGASCADDSGAFQDFSSKILQMGAQPVTLLRYRRQAFAGSDDSRTRLTIDTHIEYYPVRTLQFNAPAGAWRRARVRDDPSLFILELKFQDRPPQWVADLIRRMELKRTPASKYLFAMSDRGAVAAWRAANPRDDNSL